MSDNMTFQLKSILKPAGYYPRLDCWARSKPRPKRFRNPEPIYWWPNPLPESRPATPMPMSLESFRSVWWKCESPREPRWTFRWTARKYNFFKVALTGFRDNVWYTFGQVWIRFHYMEQWTTTPWRKWEQFETKVYLRSSTYRVTTNRQTVEIVCDEWRPYKTFPFFLQKSAKNHPKFGTWPLPMILKSLKQSLEFLREEIGILTELLLWINVIIFSNTLCVYKNISILVSWFFYLFCFSRKVLKIEHSFQNPDCLDKKWQSHLSFKRSNFSSLYPMLCLALYRIRLKYFFAFLFSF